MASRKLALVALSAAGLALAVLWLAVLAQAQVPPSLPAVPEVAVAPPAGRYTAPPAGPASPTFWPVPPALQRPVTRPRPAAQVPAPARTAPDLAGESDLPGDPRGWPLGREALPGLAPSLPGPGLSAAPVITFYLTYGQVTGYTDADSEVHLLLWRGGSPAGEARTHSDAVGYFAADLMQDGRWAAIQAGDALDVVVNGATTTLDVPALTGTVDAGADTVAGTIDGVPLPAEIRVGCWGSWLDVISDAGGNYTADLGGLTDLGPADYATLAYRDANGNWSVAFSAPQNGMVVASSFAEVMGSTEPGAVVTVTVEHDGGLATNTAKADPRTGRWYVYFDAIGAGDVVSAEVGGATVVDTVAALGLEFDLADDQVYGSGPANSEVSVYAYHRQGHRGWYSTRRAPIGPDGLFSADFGGDGLDTWNSLSVVHHDTPQADTLVYANPPLAEVQWPWNEVAGYAQPGAGITATLSDSGGPIEQVATTAGSYGYYWAYLETPFQPGQQMAVQGGGLDATVDLATVTAELDLAAEVLHGQAPANTALWASVGSRNFGTSFQDYATADGSGGYELDLSAVKDVHNGAYARAEVPQANDVDQAGWQMDYVYAPYLNLNETHNGLNGYVPAENAPVTLTLRTAGGAHKGVRQAQSSATGYVGWQQFHDEYGNVIDIEPGDRVEVQVAGWSETVVAPQIDVEVDAEADRVTGTGPADGFVEVYVRYLSPVVRVPTDGDGHFLADFAGLIDLGPNAEVEVAVYDDNWNRRYAVGSAAEVAWVDLDLYRTRTWGCANDVPITITTVYTQMVIDWGTCWDVEFPDTFDPSDVVTVTAGAGVYPVVIAIPDPFSAFASSVTDTVWGEIDALDHEEVDVDLWGFPTQHVETDADGHYSATFAEVPRGAMGDVNYYAEIVYAQVGFHRRFGAPDLLITADYAHDYIGGDYEAGHTVHLALADGGGLKATADVDTPGGWWNTQSWDWTPGQPDIAPGDWITGWVDAGAYTTTLRVGTIDAEVDAEEDTVAGSVDAPWLAPELISIRCEIHEEGGPGLQVDGVAPDGGGFFCDFSGLWDILPGQNVALKYVEPDGDVVQTHPSNPAPDLNLEKWVEGNNQAAPGGRSVFTLRVRNDGGAASGAIVVTDTLPAGAAYVADSSGAAPDAGPGWVAWTLPGLAPGEERQFRLVLANSAQPGEVLRNRADAWTQDEWDTGNNGAEAEVTVVDDQPDLYANKNPTPGDPAPGQTFLWEIGYGNNRPVPAGPVELIDTFPAGTELVSWYSENRYGLWQEVETGDRLVLTAAAVPGWWHDRIILQLRVDPGLAYGTQLRNRVEISVPDDANPDDDWQERDAWVGPPRRDAGTNKTFSWGRLVSGGEVMYSLHCRNGGNVAALVTVTDTLPAGAHLAEAWAWVGPDYVPFPPAYVDDEIAVWELGVLEPGAWINLDARLAIDEGTQAGADLTNCVAIAMEGDGYPFNDMVCVTDGVREPGPNLRLYKSAWWNGQGQIEYEIRLENVGTEELKGFTIDDLYPEGTHWNGEWWVRWGPPMTATHDAPNRRLVFWVENLGPGGTAGIGYRVDLDGDLVGVQGLAFANAAQATVEGDVDAADNEAVAIAYTGPDLFAEKWVSDGRARPGEVLTFTVRTGNANRSPWEMSDGTDLVLVDRLPEGMSFVGAVWPDGSPVEPFFYDPDLGVIMFNFGRMGGEDWRWFYLAVRLEDDLRWGEVLLNRLEVLESPAVDVDPLPGNNTFYQAVKIEGMRINLPLVLRDQ